MLYKYLICHSSYSGCVSELVQIQENHLQPFDEFALDKVSFFWLHLAYAPVYNLRTISLLFFGVTVWHLSSPNSILVSSCFFSVPLAWYCSLFTPCYFVGLHFVWPSFVQSFVVHFTVLSHYSCLFSTHFLWNFQPICNIIVESYFRLFYTIFVLSNKFEIWVDIQLTCNNIVYFKVYHLRFVVVVYGWINDQSSIHVWTQILSEISNMMHLKTFDVWPKKLNHIFNSNKYYSLFFI